MEVLNNLFDKLFNKCSKGVHTPKLDRLIETIKELSADLEATREDLVMEREMLERRIKRQDAILQAVIEVIPDMLWFKALDGKYEITNKAIRDELLFDRNPIGKDDLELSSKAKKRFGKENHTFGEVCGDSDKVVIEKSLNGTFKRDSGRFFEYGKLKGEMTYLEVNKAPVYVDGELIGVCGTGRDMTYYYNLAESDELCKGCHIVKNMFDRYKFVNKGNMDE